MLSNDLKTIYSNKHFYKKNLLQKAVIWNNFFPVQKIDKFEKNTMFSWSEFAIFVNILNILVLLGAKI